MSRRLLRFGDFRAIANDLVPMRQVHKVVLHKEVIESDLQKKQTENVTQETDSEDADMPAFGLSNPYEPPPAKCVLCQHKVDLNYKNTRLLSQFISNHTGQIYGRHITGLCIYMQRRVAQLINRSRVFGYMPYRYKDPRYLKDPKLFDPYKSR